MEIDMSSVAESAASEGEGSAAFTQGPWRSVRAKTTTDGAYDFAIVAGDKQIIAEVFGRCAEADYPPAVDNAQLIANAPDMHAALNEFLRLYGGAVSDIRSAHQNRGNGAAEWMVEDDREFLRDFRALGNRVQALINPPTPAEAALSKAEGQ